MPNLVCCYFLDVPSDSLEFATSVFSRFCTRVNWPVRSTQPPSLFTIRVEKVWNVPYHCIPKKFHYVAVRYCDGNLLFVLVEVGARALFWAQNGRVVVFNTHSYLAPSLDMSRAMPLSSLMLVLACYGLIFTLTLLSNSRCRGFKRQTQMIAVPSASWFSKHSIQ